MEREFEKVKEPVFVKTSWKLVTPQKFKELQERFGSDANIARAFGVTPGAVKYKRGLWGIDSVVREYDSAGWHRKVGRTLSEFEIDEMYKGRKYR